MEPHQTSRAAVSAAILVEDEEIAHRVVAGEHALFELLMRRHNQRVYRAVRAVIRDEAEIEDVMQQAYVQAYTHLAQFAGTARFSTWLVRIAINEALSRRRRSQRLVLVEDPESAAEAAMPFQPDAPTPEAHAATRELAAFIEQAVDALPELYRTTFVMREVEGMTTAETAEAIGASDDVVKTRLHRARTLVHQRMAADAGVSFGEAFRFGAERCDRLVVAVMARIAGA